MTFGHLHSAIELGRAVHQQRRLLNISQSQLAASVGVSRQWIIAFERGKEGVEIGIVLRTIAALGLRVSLVPTPPSGAGPDIDAIVERARQIPP